MTRAMTLAYDPDNDDHLSLGDMFAVDTGLGRDFYRKRDGQWAMFLSNNSLDTLLKQRNGEFDLRAWLENAQPGDPLMVGEEVLHFVKYTGYQIFFEAEGGKTGRTIDIQAALTFHMCRPVPEETAPA